MFSEVLEEFCDCKKDSSILLFNSVVFFDVEDTGVDRLIDRVGVEVTSGDKFLPLADTAMFVHASGVAESVLCSYANFKICCSAEMHFQLMQ